MRTLLTDLPSFCSRKIAIFPLSGILVQGKEGSACYSSLRDSYLPRTHPLSIISSLETSFHPKQSSRHGEVPLYLSRNYPDIATLIVQQTLSFLWHCQDSVIVLHPSIPGISNSLETFSLNTLSPPSQERLLKGSYNSLSEFFFTLHFFLLNRIN